MAESVCGCINQEWEIGKGKVRMCESDSEFISQDVRTRRIQNHNLEVKRLYLESESAFFRSKKPYFKNESLRLVSKSYHSYLNASTGSSSLARIAG